MRLRTFVLAGVAVVVIAAVAVMILAGSIDRFRPRIQATLEQKLKRSIAMGPLGLSFPLQIKMQGLTIGESPAFHTGRQFATANEVYVSAGLFSLLTGNPEVKSLVLEKPQIELVKNAAGVWNFSSLGDQNGGGSDSTLKLGLLQVNDGQVGYTDQTTKEPRAVYDHIDVKLSDFAPGQRFGIQLGAHFPGEGKQTLEFKGNVGPMNAGTAAVDGRLTLQQFSLGGLNRFAAGTIPTGTDATVSGQADVTTQGDSISSKGNLQFADTVVRGSKIGYPISADYDVSADSKAKKLQIRSAKIALGPTKFDLAGSADLAPTPVLLNLTLKTSDSSFAELAKLAGSFGVGFDPAYTVNGKISADVAAKGPATAPQLSGSMSAKNLTASGGEIKQPVAIPEIDLTFTPETVLSNTFTAQSGSTALAISFSLSQYTSKNMNADATLKTSNANIAELLNIAKAYGLGGAQGVSGTGTLSLDVHVKGPVANSSAMTYAGSGSIANAVLNTPALTKPLNVASANLRFSENSAGIDNLTASLGSTTLRGSLQAKNFAAPQVQFNLSADKIDTEELQRITASGNKPAAKSNEPGMLQKMSGNGSLSAGLIQADDIVLKNVTTKVQLDKGVIELSPLSAEAFGGKATGGVTADMRPAIPLCTVKMKVAGVDANSLLSAMSSMKNTVYGSLAADSNLRFALTNGNSLAGTLNGTLAFNLTNGLIKNIDLINEVEKIGKFLKSAPAGTSTGGGTAIKKFSGTLNITNGLATTDNLNGVLNIGSLDAKGTLNLANQNVNMRVNAVMGSTASQSVGGSGVGGFLSTALANNKGELVIPVIVTGNMAHPTVTPDAQAIAQMKLNKLLPGTGGAAGILGGLLGGGQQKQGSGTSNQNQPADPLGSLLNGLMNKKKPNK